MRFIANIVSVFLYIDISMSYMNIVLNVLFLNTCCYCFCLGFALKLSTTCVCSTLRIQSVHDNMGRAIIRGGTPTLGMYDEF